MQDEGKKSAISSFFFDLFIALDFHSACTVI